MSLSPEEIMSLVYHEDRDVFFKRMEDRLRGEPAGATYEFRAVRKDGSIIWLSALASRVEYDGQPAVQGMFLDIDDSRKAVEILRVSEARYRELANSLPDIVFETDLKGQLLFANERAAEISGYSHRELEEGLNIMQFLLPEDREKAMKGIQRLLSGGNYVPVEYSFVRKDGSVFPALISATPCISKNKLTGLRGLVIDITERKRTEESLEKEKQELNRIIDSSPIIIFYKDTEGKFIRVNEAFAEAQRIPKDEFIGKTVFDFYSAEIARGMANDDLEVLKSGHPRFGIIEQYESARGMRWVQTDKVPTFDKNGVSTGLVGFAQDVTGRKKTEDKLRESIHNNELICEKLRVVGGLTRHDVGNKLMAAKSNLYLLKKQLGDRSELAKYFDGIDLAFASSDKLFEFSSFYERIGVEEVSKIDVAECFNQAVALFQELGTIRVVNDCQGLAVWADSLLRQLFYNLIDNSLKHGEKATRIRLHYNKEGDELKLFYEDDGVGIPEANKQKLFDQGFSTGRGSGLGLHLIKKMIEVYGWTIEENGQPGKGAKFTIRIPKIDRNSKMKTD